jgi:hypothetical protein
MFKKLARFALALATCATVSAVTAEAQSITPTGSRFGTLTGATFGGTGIPNDAVMVQENVNGLVMGLTATQRCGTVLCNPALSNNGFGRFFAGAGTDLNPPSPGDPYAQWNWNFFIGGTGATNYNYKLFYDFNSASGNSEASHGTIALPWAVLSTGPFQNSWNLGMNFLASPGVGVAPPSGLFDPNAIGEYTFAIVAFNKAGVGGLEFGSEVGRVAMAVSTVPEPSSYMLVAAGLGVLATVSRRRARMMV